MTQNYNDPIGGTPSSIGDEQFNMWKYQRKALIEVAKKAVFSPLASTISMPKHMGKTIKRYHYIPLLDDANINDEGIDADGLIVEQEKTIKIIGAFGSGTGIENIYETVYAVGAGSTSSNATTAAEAKALDILVNELGFVGADYAAAKADAIAKGTAVDDTTPAVMSAGNMYGSSKDVGTVAGKMPRLDENGGQKNRVGGRRIELEGSFERFGFYRTWTKDSLDFDTDDELHMHQTREMMNAAHEVTEDAIQIDLLNGAGLIRYAGDATAVVELSGETGAVDLVTYTDLMKLSIDLDNNRCDKDTKMILGSRLTDTKTVRATRIMYIGSELQPMIERMAGIDGVAGSAFVSIEKYASAGTSITGEIGKVGQFTIVVAQEMMHWEGAGAAVSTNDGYRETGGNYDVYPMLVVGNDSFNTIGFQSDGKSSKFKIINKMPGEATADLNDPYGLTGFSSITWFYGSLVVRPERIAVVKTVAEW
jgi:N4-gp56 family major capsid protein|tara:strand:- start:1632 stop:3068 length:1437 start_codon:yes stop_codon:yes gene_type:complete